MTREEAHSLARNLMRATIAIPGARRDISLDGVAGIAFIEALGATAERWIHERDGEIYVREIAQFKAAHGFKFEAVNYLEPTESERAQLLARPHREGGRCVSSVAGRDGDDQSFGADIQ